MLNTVIKGVLHVAKSMEQQHVVLTVDEALYQKLLELKWSVEAGSIPTSLDPAKQATDWCW